MDTSNTFPPPAKKKRIISPENLAFWLVLIAVGYTNASYKFWNNPGRIIAHDVIIYYQYLPATFIEKDISLRFVEKDPEFYKKRYWGYKMSTGKFTSKMTMGMAVMYSPFFFAGHALSGPLGYEQDGFSPPYRFALIISSVFYLALGLYFLKRFLRKLYGPWPVAITLIAIGLGTNLYFYTTIEPTMSHVYSFFLFTLFITLMDRWLERATVLRSVGLGLITGLIILVRPTNGIILLLVPLWKVLSSGDLIERFRFFGKNIGSIGIAALCAILVLIPQVIYYKYTSGKFYFYGYGEEGFFFNDPAFIGGLFSYRKGWLVYTPIMVFSLLGLIVLYLKNRKYFWPLITFTVVNMYIVFSWWCWWYGGGFGQRALIESYALLAIPFAAFVSWVWNKKWIWPAALVLVFAALIALNIYQTRQYYTGAIHWGSMSKEAYWDSFLRLRPSEDFPELLDHPDYKKALKGEER